LSEKKYFWLKLKDDFFNSKEIKKLRRIAGGDTYVIIFLKLQLLSIKKDGMIEFDGTETDIIEQLHYQLDEQEDNIKVTIAFLLSNNLIEIKGNNDISVISVLHSIGSESSVAERVRKHREKKELGTKVLQCNNDVTKCNIEIDIEKELELELEKEKEKEINKKSILTDTKKKDFFDVESDFFQDDNFSKTWKAFVEMRKKIKKPLTQLAVQRMMNKLHNYNIDIAEKMLELSIINCWADVYELKQKIEPKIEPKTNIEKGKELFESYKGDLYFHWNNSTKEEKNIIVEYIKTLDYNNQDRVELRGITEKKANGKLADMISSIGNIESPNKFKILAECKKLYALKLAKEIKDKDNIIKIVEQMDYWTADKLNKWLIDNK
jgi:predicted phage replisome organizer